MWHVDQSPYMFNTALLKLKLQIQPAPDKHTPIWVFRSDSAIRSSRTLRAARAYRAKGATMRIIRCVRSLLFAVVVLFVSVGATAQIGVSISIGPPALPVYEQPICPGDGYLWTPGYWAYNYDVTDYYWVPGTW